MVPESQEAVVEVIKGALEKSFGHSAAKAVDFYFDTRIAVTDPAGYTKMLQKTFMRGAGPLIEAITEELCRRFGVSHAAGMTLPECLTAISRPDGRQTP